MNEPVAWIRQGEYGKPIIVQNPLHQFSYQAESAKWDDIPLYTHPAKTLTISDKDILKIIHDKFTKFGFEADYIVEDTELIEFARTILRKAQEK